MRGNAPRPAIATQVSPVVDGLLESGLGGRHAPLDLRVLQPSLFGFGLVGRLRLVDRLGEGSLVAIHGRRSSARMVANAGPSGEALREASGPELDPDVETPGQILPGIQPSRDAVALVRDRSGRIPVPFHHEVTAESEDGLESDSLPAHRVRRQRPDAGPHRGDQRAARRNPGSNRLRIPRLLPPMSIRNGSCELEVDDGPCHRATTRRDRDLYRADSRLPAHSGTRRSRFEPAAEPAAYPRRAASWAMGSPSSIHQHHPIDDRRITRPLAWDRMQTEVEGLGPLIDGNNQGNRAY